MRDEEQIGTKQHHRNHRIRNKKKCNTGTALEPLEGKVRRKRGGGGGGGGGKEWGGGRRQLCVPVEG